MTCHSLSLSAVRSLTDWRFSKPPSEDESNCFLDSLSLVGKVVTTQVASCALFIAALVDTLVACVFVAFGVIFLPLLEHPLNMAVNYFKESKSAAINSLSLVANNILRIFCSPPSAFNRIFERLDTCYIQSVDGETFLRNLLKEELQDPTFAEDFATFHGSCANYVMWKLIMQFAYWHQDEPVPVFLNDRPWRGGRIGTQQAIINLRHNAAFQSAVAVVLSSSELVKFVSTYNEFKQLDLSTINSPELKLVIKELGEAAAEELQGSDFFMKDWRNIALKIDPPTDRVSD